MGITKIAGGVFLGIVAVLIVMSVPNWLEDLRREHAEDVVHHLTPELLIARCGPAINDRTERLGVVRRAMTYENEYGVKSVLEFSGNPDGGKWIFISLTDPTTKGADELLGREYKTDFDPENVLNALPCIDK